MNSVTLEPWLLKPAPILRGSVWIGISTADNVQLFVVEEW